MLRAAEFDLSTLDVEKRTVELVWTTGAAVLRGGFFTESFWEELSLDPQHVDMTRLQNGAAPLLNTHRTGGIEDIIGVVDKAWLTPTEGRALVRFDSGAAGSDAMRRVQEKTLRNVSTGYQTLKMQEVESKDPKRGKIPTYRAIQWQPYELSLVPVGADAGASTRSGGGMTPCEFIQEQRTMSDPVETPATNTTNTTTQPAAATQTPAPVVQPTEAQRAQISRDAEARILGIQRVARALNRPQTEVDAAIAAGTSLNDFRAAAVDALANAPADQGGPVAIDKRDHRIQAGADQRDKFLQRSENWLIQRSGAANMVKAAAEKNGQKVDLDPGESRGMSLVDMARECLERAGVRTRGMDVMQMIGQAFTYRGISGGNTTSDFPVLLENVMHKTLLAAYMTTPDTWRQWCVVGTVTDFRAHNRYRQGSLGVYADMAEGDEYKNASIPDGEKQSITASTKGRIIAITRQTIINDDMGALNNLATMLGRAGALTIEVAAYASLLSNAGGGPTMSDGNPLFHASHNNLTTGALSVANVDVDRVAMKSQKDPSGNELLELTPAILLLPVGLGGQARVINNAQYDVDKIANARNQEPNKVVGLYRTIVDTARLTGTARYSFADPSIAPVMEVAFLNGQDTPYLELQQGWRIDGSEYKARLDFGIAARDWRGAVKSSGA